MFADFDAHHKGVGGCGEPNASTTPATMVDRARAPKASFGDDAGAFNVAAKEMLVDELRPCVRKFTVTDQSVGVGCRPLLCRKPGLTTTSLWTAIQWRGLTDASQIEPVRRVARLAVLLPAVAVASPVPTDPRFAEQTNLHDVGIDAVGAWRLTKAADAVVGVIDCGVEFRHPDLMHKFYLNPGELPAAADRNHDRRVDWDELEAEAAIHPSWGLQDVDGDGLDLYDVFSSALRDGVDGDGNGYIDDISGWDFDDDDPVADDITKCGHGNGRSGILAAAWNGVGTAGILADGRVVSLRTSDSILHTADAVARAIAYAGEMRLDSVNMSLGAFGESRLLRAADEYATGRGVVLAAASGNEFVYDINVPAILESVIAVGSVSPEPLEGRPWVSKVGSTSFGPHLRLVAPSNVWTTVFPASRGWGREGGTSSATPHVAGSAALVRARARELVAAGELDHDLTAEEVRQILFATAHDIVGTKWRATDGWDRQTGYGRVQAGAAVSRVARGRIPPEARLLSPTWYAFVDPATVGTLAVTGRIAAPRAASYVYRVEVGVGVEVRQWQTLVESGPRTKMLDGVLATLPVTGFDMPPARDPLDEGDAPQSFAVTVRLTVTDDAGNMAQDRRTFYLRRDPDLVLGFPLRFEGAIEGHPLLVDLDGDGAQEIVVTDGNGEVHAVDATGRVRWTARTNRVALHEGDFAATVGPNTSGYPILGGASAADLDGDDSPEVVAATLDGAVYAWHADGRLLAGFPVRGDANPFPTGIAAPARMAAAPTLVDLDGDARPEIIIGADDGRLYSWHGDGRRVVGFPVAMWGESTPERTRTVLATAAAGDVDGDGRVELINGTTEIETVTSLLFSIRAGGHADARGPFAAGWPIRLWVSPIGIPMVGEGIAGAPTLADLDGDGQPEVIAGGFAGYGAVFGGDGGKRAEFDRFIYESGSDTMDPVLVGWTNGAASIGDLDRDGVPDAVAPLMGLGSYAEALVGEDRTSGEQRKARWFFGAWNTRSGAFLRHWPREMAGIPFLQNAAIADLDGDGFPEVIAGSSELWLHAWNHAGQEPGGWPKMLGGWVVASPAAGDLDGDGRIEVVAADRQGRLWAFRCMGKVQGIWWGQFHADAQRTGLFQPPVHPPSPQRSDGVGCSGNVGSGGADSTWIWIMSGLGLLLRRMVRG